VPGVGGPGEKNTRGTDMLHFSCNVCAMTATLVETPSAWVAWRDHMECHTRPHDYGVWTWQALQLPFD